MLLLSLKTVSQGEGLFEVIAICSCGDFIQEVDSLSINPTITIDTTTPTIPKIACPSCGAKYVIEKRRRSFSIHTNLDHCPNPLLGKIAESIGALVERVTNIFNN